ncbi:MAG: hypothetical protein K2N30_05385 [Clostridia bacterium]|nr:hypothetical protein [Clostridia bacterium]
MNNEEKFDYTYSAPTELQRREIESIKKQYEEKPQTESKLERLRKLNARVTRPPLIVGVALGVIGTLIMGLGITMVLEWSVTVWGVVVGIAGVAVIASAYPVYKTILKRNKKIFGRQIIDLSNELLNGEQ